MAALTRRRVTSAEEHLDKWESATADLKLGGNGGRWALVGGIGIPPYAGGGGVTNWRGGVIPTVRVNLLGREMRHRFVTTGAI